MIETNPNCLNMASGTGYAPIHFSVEFDNREFTQFLLQNNAERECVTRDA
eukprot:m.167920 g.167920  ORF g.167920 m.167920 type:complete len:50 (+) comp38942_c2_seq4:1759-1908(+)